ncbi:MAG: aminotransferase class I/II-fold pyridoxal phosphate-dependent enzyme, partial [Proteobacteria bacterium]|nr:aminotransferase class I/II-fold pyridoxal phosphate-dependent enzyme [Pseudomonadota bacterium]
DYMDACAMHGIEAVQCLAERSRNFQVDIDRLSDLADAADLVFLCNPNNPTGALTPRDKIARLIEKHPNTCFVVDESYLPFVDDARALSFVSDTRYSNLLVLSSMSKIFRIPGLRTGFLSGGKALIDKVMGYYQPWSVNSLAQEVITDIFANPDAIEPFYEQTRNYIKTEKEIFVQALGKISGIRLFDAPPYFILAELEKMRALDFCRAIGEDKILIRDCSNFSGLSDQFVRFSLKTREANLALARSIQKVLAGKDNHE